MSRRGRRRAALLGFVLVLAGVGGGDAMAALPRPPEPAGTLQDALTADRCETLDPSECLLPFPSDHLTTEDPTTDTGRRLDLDVLSMPRNVAGKPIDPTDWNRNDGFSPGQPAVTYVPGLDAAATGLPPITDIERSLDEDSPVAVVDLTTGERHPVWAELDANASSDETRTLIIRPAVNYLEGHRYAVALRRMKDASGAPIPSSPIFAAYRDGTPLAYPQLEERRPAMERLFTDLKKQGGIHRKHLWLAWDFTVASERNLTERMLHLRDDAFGELGDAVPTYSIDEVEDTPADNRIARIVRGSFEVPRYVHLPTTGARFLYGDDGLPIRQPTPQPATFTCTIPKVATPENRATPALYGHGLLGGQGEVESGSQDAMGAEHNIISCATDWIGMATEDVPTIATILTDLSNLPALADRAQQGFLSFLFLGRLLKHPEGLAADPAFQGTLDPTHLRYYGNSQGGIMGGALTAVAQDVDRAILGVPGMNYSTLLQRSVDFDTYAIGLYASYPDESERQLLFSLMQVLWDRGESNGYAHHMTDDPLPGTPPHQVLLHSAFGDHQVANVSTEVMARTIGASVHRPAPAAHTDVEPFWGIPSIDHLNPPRSAFVVWDSGTPAPPITNTPPREGDDPHGHPRNWVEARRQMAEFWRSGTVIDVCGAGPCVIPR